MHTHQHQHQHQHAGPSYCSTLHAGLRRQAGACACFHPVRSPDAGSGTKLTLDRRTLPLLTQRLGSALAPRGPHRTPRRPPLPGQAPVSGAATAAASAGLQALVARERGSPPAEQPALRAPPPAEAAPRGMPRARAALLLALGLVAAAAPLPALAVHRLQPQLQGPPESCGPPEPGAWHNVVHGEADAVIREILVQWMSV